MKKLILSLLLLSVYSYAVADEIVTLKSGEQAILLDSGRWSIITPREKETHKEVKPTGFKSQKKAIETYEEIELSNLLQDIDAFRRKKIQTEAFAVAYEFMLMAKEDKMDSSSLLININNLPQEERKNLREECINGCNIRVYGRVGKVIQGDMGIIADKVIW